MLATTAEQVLVRGGTTVLGSADHYPEERPVVEVTVENLWFDRHPVTNAQFARFVAETGHVTVAETAPDPAEFPGADPALLVPGSQVFTQPPRPVPLDDWTRWWRWQPGASWRAPQGPGSSWESIPAHPVVHVGWADAAAYARWAGKRLPTEEQWEHAARGGRRGAEYAWGDELTPDGVVLANTWQGPFPWRSDDARGFHRTSPVGSFPANDFGLHDMIGNVWEWTASPWTASHLPRTQTGAARHPADDDDDGGACCGGEAVVLARLTEADRMVTKGGSHLCSPFYCRRYRPAARQGHGVNDTASHVGFRCVHSVASE
ncbi:formylglycine-generating enzyme family protein [Promicromonospora sp. NPDC050249]|uniref:formylglycine-generating enzyme family protein n=1 Tax=Promicromonospora sp. NPDC050249 TaxID=3154743 RepID=UPI0034074EC5